MRTMEKFRKRIGVIINSDHPEEEGSVLSVRMQWLL